MAVEDMRKIVKDHVGDSVTNVIDDDGGKGPLEGYGITVKECICVKDVESTGGSGILKGYRPPFNATVIERIKAAGATLLAKTSQDEFGFGSFNTNIGVGYNIPKNPLDKERVCGGSSGGSAAITSSLKGEKHISLGESTGGSIAFPSSCCGVVGLTPTYGLVSRYGLIDYGNSLDKIGPIASNVKDVALALSIIAGYDPKDSTSIDRPKADYVSALSKPVKGMRVGVIRKLVESSSPAVAKSIADAESALKNLGVEVVDIDLPISNKASVAAYDIVAMCEASTNLAKYCGIRYGASKEMKGTYNEYFSSVRGAFMGQEAKRRMLIGTYARMAGLRDAHYLQALKVRTLIINEYKEAFRKVDAILSPTVPIVAPRFDEVEKLTPIEVYTMDRCVVPVNFAGLPHISIPFGRQGDMPIGILLTGDHFAEETILSLASALEVKG